MAAPIKPFVGSFTALKTYRDTCAHRMYRQYIAKDLGPFVETPEMKWGNDVHAAMELRVTGKKPLPADMQVWENFVTPFDAIVERDKIMTEKWFGMKATGHPTDSRAADVWYRGKIDIVLMSGDAAYLPDWKTGSSSYESPFELECNAVLLHSRFPHLKRITGCYIWLRENRMGQVYDLSHTRETFKEIRRLMQEIAALPQRADAWEKRKSGLCGYCSVADCEHHYVARPR